MADKDSEDILKADLKAKISTVVADLKKTDVKADKRIDEISEKSDIVEAAASSNYEAGAPVSQGNLYYYYYPVAAYPVHSNGHGGYGASDKVSSSSDSGSLLESPLVFILVPLVLLLVAAPLVAMFAGSSVSTSRSFDSRSSNLDEKFGSFAELQEAIDQQLMKYTAALDSDRCMDRIVCELGVRASNIPHKNLFFR